MAYEQKHFANIHISLTKDQSPAAAAVGFVHECKDTLAYTQTRIQGHTHTYIHSS